MIVDDALPWTSDDIANWAAFLNTKTGQRLIPKLVESCPALLGCGDTNNILIRSGEVRGFAETARVLLSLTHEPEGLKKDPTAYPSPEDDSAWDDKEKLNSEH